MDIQYTKNLVEKDAGIREAAAKYMQSNDHSKSLSAYLQGNGSL